MNRLAVKEVKFHDVELLAIQVTETGKIYAGINKILKELGLDDRQIEYQRSKWTEDKVIAKGVQKFSYPSENGEVHKSSTMFCYISSPVSFMIRLPLKVQSKAAAIS